MTVKAFSNYCLQYMKNYYSHLMKYYKIPLNDAAFSWHNGNYLIIYIIFIPSRYGNQSIFFACDNNVTNKNVLHIVNLTNVSGRIKLIAEQTNENVIKQLVAIGAITKPKDIINNFINKSLIMDKEIVSLFNSCKCNDTLKHFLRDNIGSLFYDEIDNEDDKYKQINKMNLNLSPRSFFERTFSFNNVIRGINNKQFTEELSECLYAYNRGKWFICSTSIGSILEELMFNIIKINRNYYENKYNNKNNKKINQLKGYSRHLFKSVKSSYNKIMRHNQATAKDYEIVFQANPIKATDRSIRLIQALFMIRNSVDHYNSGRTNRNLCDLLLHGITDMYNDYYIKMIDFKHKYDKRNDK